MDEEFKIKGKIIVCGKCGEKLVKHPRVPTVCACPNPSCTISFNYDAAKQEELKRLWELSPDEPFKVVYEGMKNGEHVFRVLDIKGLTAIRGRIDVIDGSE